MQQPHGERRTRAHPTSGRQIAIVMNFHAAIDSTVAQYLADCWVSDFVDTMAILDFRINDANPVFEKRRQITTA
jgi:hypothetical protein